MIWVEAGAGSSPRRLQAISSRRGSVERPVQARAVAIELEGPDAELETEAGRLGVDAVRAADADGAPVLAGAADDSSERAVEPFQNQSSRATDLKRQRRIDDVRGGEPVVEPASFRPELLADRVDEGSGVVMERGFDLTHSRRIGRLRCCDDRLHFLARNHA
jgi:hypothetical protein